MTEDFWNKLSEGEIHVRDSLRFELKSEFAIDPFLKHIYLINRNFTFLFQTPYRSILKHILSNNFIILNKKPI